MNYRNVITRSLLGIGLLFAVLPTTPVALGRELGSAEKERIANLALGAAYARFSNGVKLFIFERTAEKQIKNIKSCVNLLNQFIDNKYQIVYNIMESNVALYDVDAFGRRPPNDKIFERVIDHKIKEYLSRVGYGAVLVINNIWTSISPVFGEQWWNSRSVHDTSRSELVFYSVGFLPKENLSFEVIDDNILDFNRLSNCRIMYSSFTSSTPRTDESARGLWQEIENLGYSREHSRTIGALLIFVAATNKNNKKIIFSALQKILNSNIGK